MCKRSPFAMEYVIREAISADLPAILSLYGQPHMDNGKVTALGESNAVLRRISSYPNYRLFVASVSDHIVGTYALFILDKLAHMGALSALVEDDCRFGRVAPKGSWQGYDDPCHGSLS
jgi:hypothetical protein